MRPRASGEAPAGSAARGFGGQTQNEPGQSNRVCERTPELHECSHPAKVLLRLDCGSGGFQFRRYCRECWRDLEGAIPHGRALAELHGEPPILGDLDLLHKARDAYARRDPRARELF